MTDTTLYSWVILPLIVFLARFTDVTLGTLRIIFLSRGRRYLAPALGFVEVLIWITVVSQIVRNAQNFVAYLAYAAGFAAGNYVGMVIDNKLAIGTLIIRMIRSKDDGQLVNELRTAGYGATFVDGQGASGPVSVIYTVVPRKEATQVINLIESTAPKTFFTVEELRSVQQGIFPARRTGDRFELFGRKKK